MKRIHILALVLCCLLLAGCKGGSFKDIKVTSARIISIVPEGLTDLNALIEVGVHNPTVALEITNMIGMARFEDMNMLSVSADQLIVEGHSDKEYQIPLRGHIEEGFNPFRLLRLLGDEASLDDVTVSFKARVALRGGLGKNIEMVDIPILSLLNLSEENEQTQL